MDIGELICLVILAYASFGVFTMLIYMATPNWDDYDIHEFMIAWPIILIGLIIKTVKKVFKYVKE